LKALPSPNFQVDIVNFIENINHRALVKKNKNKKVNFFFLSSF